MKLIFATILGICCSFTAASQAQNTKVPGFVTLQNSGKKSAFPLTISVSEGAKISKTNTATGYFEVSCPASGEFFLSVEKEGHEVVNPRATHVYFFQGKPSVDTIRICLNVEGAWLELADQYLCAGYSIATSAHDAAFAELKQRRGASLIADSTYRKSLRDLQMRANRAYGQVPDIAERSAQTDADYCSPAYRLALRALSEKDPAKALKNLSNAATSDDWALRARLNALTMKETEAYADYELALRASPHDFQLIREYTRYLFSSWKTLEKGKEVWQKALLIARHENERATALQGTGVAEANKNNFQEAVRDFEQAAIIRDSLASRNAFFAADFGFVCRVLAKYLGDLGNVEQGKYWALKGAAAWAKVPNPCGFSFCTEPMALEFWLAGNPGRTKDEIMQRLNKIINGLDQLAEHYTARGYLSKTYYLSQRAQQFQYHGDFARAMADWRELASICEEYETEWPIFIESSRLDYWKFAPVAAQPTQAGGDEWLRTKGIAHLHKTAEQMPSFEITLAYCLNERGNGLAAQGKSEEALLVFEEVIRMTEPLVDLWPFDMVPIRGMALGLAGDIWLKKGAFEKGLALIDEAIALNQNCQVCNPFSKAGFLSAAHFIIGQAYAGKQDEASAERRFKEAKIYYAEVVKMQPIKQNVAKSYFNLSMLNMAQLNLAYKKEDTRYLQEIKKNISEQEAMLALFPDDPDFAQSVKELKDLKAMIKD